MLWKVLAIGIGVLAVVVVVAVLYFGPRNLIGIMTYGQQAREGSLRVGDAAPIVNLAALDGTSERPLSDWIGEQPLVLVFGSFT